MALAYLTINLDDFTGDDHPPISQYSTITLDPGADHIDEDADVIHVRTIVVSLDQQGKAATANGVPCVDGKVPVVAGVMYAVLAPNVLRDGPHYIPALTAGQVVDLSDYITPGAPLTPDQAAILTARIKALETTPPDHGALTGLGDDDHPQYLTTGRGDERYVQGSDSRLTLADTAVQPADLNAYATDAELTAGLATKADASHSHTIADTTGLQTALDGKAATSHTHTGVYAPALGADDNYVTDAEKAALHTHPAVIAQGATQAAARTAIGAGTSSFSGAYADLTGKPTLGTAAATASTDYATAAHTHDDRYYTEIEADGRYRRKLTGLVANSSASGVMTANAAILAAALVPNASVVIPAGTYYTDEVAVTGPVDIRGEDITTTLRNDSGSVFVLAGNQINVSTLTIRSGGGNHTIRQSGFVDQGHWDRVRLYQLSDGFSIWDSSGFGLIDMRFVDFLSWHTQTATVPSWKLHSVGGAINSNSWTRFRAQFSGNYHFWVESTTSNSQHANAWRDATWEVTTGGMIKLIGCRDYLIENSSVWDLAVGNPALTTLKRHGIWADTNGASASCVGTIRNHRRLDSTCDPGIQDIMLPSSFRGDGTVLENCRSITSANPLLIDINNNVSRVMIDGPTASSLATIANASTTALYDRNGITLPTTQTFKIGSALVGFGLAQANVAADPGSIAANSELDVTIAVPGTLAGDALSVSPGNGALEAGIGIVGCWVPSPGNVTFRLRNFTGTAIDPGSRTWRIRVWR
jgi:hypothetical protein